MLLQTQTRHSSMQLEGLRNWRHDPTITRIVLPCLRSKHKLRNQSSMRSSFLVFAPDVWGEELFFAENILVHVAGLGQA